MESSFPRYLIAGKLWRDYLIFPSGKAYLNQLGGNAIHCSVGLMVWQPEARPGIVARVGNDFPPEWLSSIENAGIITSGIKNLDEDLDNILFTAFSDDRSRSHDDPIPHFATASEQFPRDLLNYVNPTTGVDSKNILNSTSLRQEDIPNEFLDVITAHICPVDYLSHSLLTAVLRQADFSTITLMSSPKYMNPMFRNEVMTLLVGLTAFITTEAELSSLLPEEGSNIPHMTEKMSELGCRIVIVLRSDRSIHLFNSETSSHWYIPSYPVKWINPIGAEDAFCGGFLAGYKKTYDPVEGALHGCISTSLAVEGTDPLHPLDALPLLPEARMNSIRSQIKQI